MRSAGSVGTSFKRIKEIGLPARRSRSSTFTARNARKRVLGEPTAVEFATNDTSRAILRLLGSGPDIGRAIAAEPGIPPARASALRHAFMATMSDPKFLAEMAERKLNVEPLSGEEVQNIVASVMATPPELVKQAKGYLN